MQVFNKRNTRAAARRLAGWWLLVALACAAAGSGAQPAAATSPEATTGAEAGPANTRSLFLGTIASLIAQNVGNSVGAALAHGLSGSITRWFSADPAAAAATAAAQPASSAKSTPHSEKKSKAARRAPELHAGVAFEVHRIDDKGGAKPVDPNRHIFRTGDRFQVFYRPSLPGRVKVININPEGRKTRIDAVNVAAGELVTLGPYQLVDKQGTEILRLVLEPCSTPALSASTRSIVKAAAVSPNEQSGMRIRDCADAGAPSSQAATRSIRKATLEGSTSYALDRLSKEEVHSGQIAPRSVEISLRHR